MLQARDQVVRYGDLRQVRGDPCGHLRAGHDQDAGEDSPVVVKAAAPGDEFVHVETGLNEPEVRAVLPFRDSTANGCSDAERKLGGRVSACLSQHLPNGQIRPRTLNRVISANEQKVTHPVRGGREHVPAKPEQVTVATVDARDRTPTKVSDFPSDRDAGDGGSTDV